MPRPGACVDPRLRRLAVLEPTVSPTDSDIENEIELFVKRRCVTAGVCPGVVKSCAVAVGEREAAVGPEGLAKMREHYLEEPRIDVSEYVFLAPLGKLALL